MQVILDTYPHLIDCHYVFKSCQRDWIVVLEKLHDTVTNESRDKVVDRRYAKFRADKLKVILIFNKYDPQMTQQNIKNSIYNKVKVIYKVNEIVYANSFDMDLNKIRTNGIHYHLTIEPAYYYGRDKVGVKKHGKFMSWHDNGQKENECDYVNGVMHGKFTNWYENGQKFEEGECINGKMQGKCARWYSNGKICWNCEYMNGEIISQDLSDF